MTISSASSFFLFGPRGSGKSTLIKNLPFLKNALVIDLLKPQVEDRYRLDPGLLEKEVSALHAGDWVVIDEVQKLPKLLDLVHSLIEEKKIHFALTGSSSRKLKRGASNLLAGRAFHYRLYPFIQAELKSDFDLNEVLTWGTLPKVTTLKNPEDKALFLESYVHTYLKEEIQIEQLVRNIDPFRMFLPIAAQMSGQLINYSNISRDTGVSYKTIETYFQILEETLLGFFLLPFERSVRKVQKQSPKFYFVDNGIKRALEGGKLRQALLARASDYGNAFEAWFIFECQARNQYMKKDYRFSFLRTRDDVEIDLIIQKPNGDEVLIEIKSTSNPKAQDLKSLSRMKESFPKAELMCVCQVDRIQKWDGISVLPWKSAFKALDLE
ncbi:MAG: AAA family ATPase [Bdellovibrio sp.]